MRREDNLMKEETRFMLNGMVNAAAFIYAWTGYQTAAVVLGLTGLAIAAVLTNVKFYQRNTLFILACALLEILIAQAVGLGAVMPSVSFLLLCNVTVTLIWLKKRFLAVEQMMEPLLTACISLLVFNLVVPHDPTALAQILTLILLAFGPVLAAYALYLVAKAEQNSKRQIRMRSDAVK